MGSPHLKDACRTILPRWNLATGEESSSQIGAQPILTRSCLCLWVPLPMIVDEGNRVPVALPRTPFGADVDVV